MNSHFKKIRKGNTGKIGVWDVKKIKISRKSKGSVGNNNQLTTVKVVLRKAERRPFYPHISSLGVKIDVNTVNIIKLPLYFQSRREISSIHEGMETSFVNNKKIHRRGLGSQC